jgi:predicted NBD/HSP70 family sugar kinase
MKKINYQKVNTASSRTIRSINERIVLNLIRDRQPISRAEIARTTGLQRSTVTLLVQKLLQEKVIYQKERGPSEGGRPPDLLYLNGHGACVLALDVGVTQTTLALGDFNGKVLWEEQFATSTDPEEFLKMVVSRVKAILRSRKPGRAFEAIGVSVPGLVNVDTGIVIYAPNLKWHQFALGPDLSRLLGLPVSIDNDANLCALAEMWHGSIGAVSSHNLVYLLVADGIGTGVAFDGQIYRGFSGGAGEFGHMCIDLNGPRCSCGNRGCLEVLASNRALIGNYQDLCNGHPGGHAPSRLTVKGIIAKARAGDQRALAALRQTGRYLGIGIANLIVSLNPEVVVVGGEIAEAWDLMSESILQIGGGEVCSRNRSGTKLVPSTVKESPSLVGALLLALSGRLEIPNVA